MTICPCCGFKFHGALSSGCRECGARAVGEPLPRPEHELPSYGRALVLAVTGSLVVLVFLIQTISAFVQHYSGLGFWHWIAAGETAAWHLKWISFPVLFGVLWFGRKLYRSILVQPERFCGVKYARRGLLASTTVAMLMVMLIGITVPARLRQRQLSKEAAIRAQGYTLELALLEYKLKYKTYPADLKDLSDRIADPDGSLAAVLSSIESGAYRPSADMAANAAQKPRSLRRVVISKISLSTATDDTPSGGLAFTNYVVILPGEDKITGTDDDWVVRDGMVGKKSDFAKGGVGCSVSAGALQP